MTTRGLGPYVTVENVTPLLADLPVPVLRDIIAAGAHRHPGSPGTVSSVFLRASELLECARIASSDRTRGGSFDTLQPGQLLGEPDIAFVNAARASVAAAGGELMLPPAPILPNWVNEDERALAPAFGWLRLAVADTDGDLLHSTGCSSVRSRTVLRTDHQPWWQVMLAGHQQLCNRCGGPSIRDLVPMAGFVAAVDVWQARGRTHLERWQQAAFYRLLAAPATARAQIQEPDITLAHRIVEALANDEPGDEGWAAYAVAAATVWNRLDKQVHRLTPEALDMACALVRDRLTALDAVLPDSHRLPPWPQTLDLDALRDRYSTVKDALKSTVPNLDRLLFTLPGAR